MDGSHGFHAESQMSPRSPRTLRFRSLTGLVGGEICVVSATPIPSLFLAPFFANSWRGQLLISGQNQA